MGFWVRPNGRAVHERNQVSSLKVNINLNLVQNNSAISRSNIMNCCSSSWLPTEVDIIPNITSCPIEMMKTPNILMQFKVKTMNIFNVFYLL